MKFIADVMLGRLARRMRLLGYDVSYDASYTDNTIIRISREEERLILTRDSGLAKRPLARNHFFITSDDIEEQLAAILVAFGGQKEEQALSRCSECNLPLVPISKEDARDAVPRYVYEKHDDFLQCGECKKTFWKGTHTEKMKRANKRLFRGPSKTR